MGQSADYGEHRYDHCGPDCTVDCGHCKGEGPPTCGFCDGPVRPVVVATPERMIRYNRCLRCGTDNDVEATDG